MIQPIRVAIEDYRKQKDLSKTKLAELSSLTTNGMANFVDKGANISLFKLVNILNVLGLELIVKAKK